MAVLEQDLMVRNVNTGVIEKKHINNVRKVIRILQIIPIILSVVFIVNIFADIYCWNITDYLCPIFGTSIVLLICLYVMSKSLYVSSWSKVLYITLIVAIFIELIDNIFTFDVEFLLIDYLLLSTFIVGVISSLITFLYDKYKYKF